MENNYVGKGWANEYGIRISIKKEDIDNLPVSKYGEIQLYVGKRREIDDKSKATHYVKEDKPRE